MCWFCEISKHCIDNWINGIAFVWYNEIILWSGLLLLPFACILSILCHFLHLICFMALIVDTLFWGDSCITVRTTSLWVGFSSWKLFLLFSSCLLWGLRTVSWPGVTKPGNLQSSWIRRETLQRKSRHFSTPSCLPESLSTMERFGDNVCHLSARIGKYCG